MQRGDRTDAVPQVGELGFPVAAVAEGNGQIQKALGR